MFALESIKPQSKACFLDLTAAFEELRKEKESDIQTSKPLYIIEAVIKNYTGLTVSMICLPFVGPSVELPLMSKSHPLLNDLRKDWTNNRQFAKDLVTAKKMFGSVSLASGKVSGVYANQINKINFPTNLIKDKNYSCGELAAILLHEMGHLITYYEYICRTVTTNQVMASLHRELATIESPDKRTALFIGLKEALSLSDEDFDELEKVSSEDAINVVVISLLSEKSRSELGSSIYDTNAWEQLSDEYATRMQAGHELISVLSKLYKGSGNISFRSTPAFLAMEAMKFIWFFVFMAGGPIVIAQVLLQIGITLIMVDGFGAGDYDKPGARFIRVKNQIVHALKDPSLSKEDIERLNEDLNLVSNILQEVNDRRQAVEVVFNFLGGGRGFRKSKELQQQLEAIANNELFVKASKFKLIN